MKRILITLSLLWFANKGIAQQIERFNPDTVKTYELEPVNINATRLSIETFIKVILRDTSFYAAFRNMKKYSFTAENRVYTYNKKNKVDGKIYRKIYHNNDGPYKMEYIAKQDSGKLYKKNGKYELKTVEMFDYIFMNAYNSDFTVPASAKGSKSTNESYKDKLKTLIFRPGHPIGGFPGLFIGNTQLFSANMRQYYDYSFYRGTYLDSIPVYRFKVTIKSGLSKGTHDDIMIKEMSTIFDQRNLQILGRYIDMKWDNLALNFDVQMNIELGYFDHNSTLLPTKISYKGNGGTLISNDERASFLILHKGYKRGK